MGRAPPPPPTDDPVDDWRTPPLTEKDAAAPVPETAPEPITAPHPMVGDVAAAYEKGRSQGYAVGFEAGVEKGKIIGIRLGQKDGMDALIEVITEHFGQDPVLRHTVAKVRSKLTPV